MMFNAAVLFLLFVSGGITHTLGGGHLSSLPAGSGWSVSGCGSFPFGRGTGVVVGKNLVYGCATDIELLGKGGGALATTLPDLLHLVSVEGGRCPKVAASPLCSLDPFALSLSDDCPLKLGYGADDLKLKALERGVGTVEEEPLLVELKRDLFGDQLVYDLLQVNEVAGQSVDGMDVQFVASPEVGQTLLELWPAAIFAADLLRKGTVCI